MTTALDALRRRDEAAIVWTVAGDERGRAFDEASGWRADGGVRAGGSEISFRHELDAAPRVTPPA